MAYAESGSFFPLLFAKRERERERRGGTDGIREPSSLPGFDSTQCDECRNRFIDLEIDERGLHE